MAPTARQLAEELCDLTTRVAQLDARVQGLPAPRQKKRRGATPQALAALEKSLPFKLPPSVREFLSVTNGLEWNGEHLKVIASTSCLGGPVVEKHLKEWTLRTRGARPKGTVVGWNPFANALLTLETHLKPKDGEFAVRFMEKDTSKVHTFATFTRFLASLVEEQRKEALELQKALGSDESGPETFEGVLTGAAELLRRTRGKNAVWKKLAEDVEHVTELVSMLEFNSPPDAAELKAITGALRRLGLHADADALEDMAKSAKRIGISAWEEEAPLELTGLTENAWRVLFGRLDLPDEVDVWLRAGLRIAIRGEHGTRSRGGDDDEEDDVDEDDA